ncbi:MAG: hypothetical protein F4099_06410 [Synechococcus sp. SB0673_bin_10]|uniref:Uncharacterized protein n=1 Tax=Synechococcus sp. SB0676_bin_10 TaxID=2604869 RepID=A0A6B1F9U7_9SYNE|nr:hypothetical protein [Synechococcus sp. SB0668_bin_13]MXX08192.1 hypothetical protein [Synechococcus sp. SB0667_bin_8]MYG38515.1 hypothetical protein [Synechococcus sp. SB0676_bin_10]MYG65073.1 hypothetical protein [Synechococcus sp. SB0675_bin_7]MYI72130.1 hypothetical protein [Synechococcus sp. SB0673_bin_10]MYK07384.1 hypothetical protein [Synechococcus sp. SB0670_bin_20]MYK86614.1 hypothetical protein [Synechococcus sp. SB0669_bin_7]
MIKITSPRLLAIVLRSWIAETGSSGRLDPMHPIASTQRNRKKGCKRSKCSKWKGGSCRCGRD